MLLPRGRGGLASGAGRCGCLCAALVAAVASAQGPQLGRRLLVLGEHIWGHCRINLAWGCLLRDGYSCSDRLSQGPADSDLEITLGNLPGSGFWVTYHLAWWAAYESERRWDPLQSYLNASVYWGVADAYPRFDDLEFNGGNVKISGSGSATIRVRVPATYLVDPYLAVPHIHLRVCQGSFVSYAFDFDHVYLENGEIRVQTNSQSNPIHVRSVRAIRPPAGRPPPGYAVPEPPLYVDGVFPDGSVHVAPTATPAPTASPTAVPTVAPTGAPTAGPTSGPTWAPSPAPTAAPTTAPTVSPTFLPTAAPTPAPTAWPTLAPTASPTEAPTSTATETGTSTTVSTSSTTLDPLAQAIASAVSIIDASVLEFSPIYQCFVGGSFFSHFDDSCADACPAESAVANGQCVKEASQESFASFDATWRLKAYCWGSSPAVLHRIRLAVAGHMDVPFQEVQNVTLRLEAKASDRRLVSAEDARTLLLSVALRTRRHGAAEGRELLAAFLEGAEAAASLLKCNVEEVEVFGEGGDPPLDGGDSVVIDSGGDPYEPPYDQIAPPGPSGSWFGQHPGNLRWEVVLILVLGAIFLGVGLGVRLSIWYARCTSPQTVTGRVLGVLPEAPGPLKPRQT